MLPPRCAVIEGSPSCNIYYIQNSYQITLSCSFDGNWPCKPTDQILGQDDMAYANHMQSSRIAACTKFALYRKQVSSDFN